MFDQVHVSPGGKHVLVLENAGEIRFGPLYFKAHIDGREILNRFFGEPCIWSAKGRYVALQAWNSIEERRGPDTSLFVVRTADSAFYDRPRVRRGWIVPLAFEGHKIVFQRDKSVRLGLIEEVEIDLSRIDTWRPLFPKRYLPG